MPALSELQAQFAAALLDPALEPPWGVTSHTSAHPLRRFNVHRNNVVLSLVQSLEARYPAVKRLTGEEFFRAMARLYLDAHPPASPVLIEFGSAMPAFIEQFAPATDMPYLADVARLEWLQHEAFHAGDASPLEPDVLAAIPPDALARLCFTLHPSLRLLQSPYPVLAIWRTNVHDADVHKVRLADGGDELMIVRPRLDVQLVRLPPGAHSFLSLIAAGTPLAAAAGEALAGEPRFDFQHALAGLIETGVIVAYHVGDDFDASR